MQRRRGRARHDERPDADRRAVVDVVARDDGRDARVCRTFATEREASSWARMLFRAGGYSAMIVLHGRDGAILVQPAGEGPPKIAGPDTFDVPGPQEVGPGDQFEADLDYLLEKNAELYRRLAR